MRNIILAIILVAAAPTAAWSTQLHLKPYTFKADNGKTVQAQWGSFAVPLNHGATDGKTIKLSFVRFKSTNPHPGHPIVYLAGGPGGSGIGAARGKRFPLFMALRKVADVIVLDQRGTGASNTIPSCSAKRPPPPDMTRAEFTAYVKGAVAHCIAFWQEKGFDLNAYNTRQNALDLESLRKALGAEKLNLWSISYGGTLALAALKVMPEHIDRIVLASPLSMSQTVRLPAHTQDFLERVAALIQSDPKVSKVYPDLTGTMKTVLDRLARKPVKVALPSPGGKPVVVTLTRFGLRLGTMGMLKDPSQLRTLPIMYAALAAGHYRLVAGRLHGALSKPLSLNAMSVAVRGASCLSPERAERAARQARTALLGDALNFFTDILRHSGIKHLDSAFCQPVHSNVPALVLTGTLDGRTYPAGHAQILEGLANGSEVVIENAGHDLFMGSPRVTDDIVAFFSHRRVPYRHIGLPVPHFITPAEMATHATSQQ